GQCLSIIRLHELFEVDTYPRKFSEGILVMVESNGRESCIFADEMLGQQQVVVKALPNYIRNSKAIKGLSGCTLMGDGSISLILDINGLNSGLRQRS
ncbi:MAG: chemotaxis protein CheW, partial [Bacillota bacterium]|nr:chemotaxis protein CheW [Bacillota bacterium]